MTPGRTSFLSFTRASKFFFFQAEDGIRDLTVTGVQTCALPISDERVRLPIGGHARAHDLPSVVQGSGGGGVSTERAEIDDLAADRRGHRWAGAPGRHGGWIGTTRDRCERGNKRREAVHGDCSEREAGIPPGRNSGAAVRFACTATGL